MFISAIRLAMPRIGRRRIRLWLVCISRRAVTNMDAIYLPDGESVFASPLAAGPWNASTQHGSASSALAVWVAEQIPTTAPMRTARITVDLMRPVPLGTIEIRKHIVRSGHRVQLCEVILLSKGTAVARVSVLKVRVGSEDLHETRQQRLDVPQASEGASSSVDRRSRFAASVSMRTVRGGGVLAGGAAAVWLRIDRPIVAGSSNSPAMRAAVAGDFCNGVSAALPFDDWVYLNCDLTINLVRDPVGEWILVNAETWLGTASAGGLAVGRLADTNGYFGQAAQSLVVENRHSPRTG